MTRTSTLEKARTKFNRIFSMRGRSGLVRFCATGTPSRTKTIRRRAEFRAIGSNEHRFILDEQGRLWHCPTGVHRPDGTEAGHLDHRIKLSFDAQGKVARAVMLYPSVPINAASEGTLGLLPKWMQREIAR